MDPYMEIMQTLQDNCSRILSEGYGQDEMEVDDFNRDLERKVYEFSVTYIKKLFLDINSSLIRKFGAQKHPMRANIGPLFQSVKYL